MGVEQMGDKGQVQFRVTGHKRVGGQESAASDLVGVLQNLTISDASKSSKGCPVMRTDDSLVRLFDADQKSAMALLSTGRASGG